MKGEKKFCNCLVRINLSTGQVINNSGNDTIKISASAMIAPSAIINGDVSIGDNSCIADGVIIAASGKSIVIGNNVVIMENAIIRSHPNFSCCIGDHVLIGPKACITGASVDTGCFIATNASIFHGSRLHSGTVVAINAIVHIGTQCPENTFIKINYVALGNPAVIYSPAELDQMHTELKKIGFLKYVYDIDSTGLTNKEAYTRLTNEIIRQRKNH